MTYCYVVRLLLPITLLNKHLSLFNRLFEKKYSVSVSLEEPLNHDQNRASLPTYGVLFEINDQ